MIEAAQQMRFFRHLLIWKLQSPIVAKPRSQSILPFAICWKSWWLNQLVSEFPVRPRAAAWRHQCCCRLKLRDFRLTIVCRAVAVSFVPESEKFEYAVRTSWFSECWNLASLCESVHIQQLPWRRICKYLLRQSNRLRRSQLKFTTFNFQSAI